MKGGFSVQPVLDIQNLEKNLPGFRLHHITLTLEPGYIYGLIGRNGSGKTTLIRTLLNLWQKDSGTVTVNGYPMDTMEWAAKNQIGFVLDEFLFEEKLTVKANGRMFGSCYSSYNHGQFLRLCDRFGLNPNQKTGKLSKGQKSRFQLAFALSHDASLYIMDEPASGLDPLFRSDLTAYMQQIVEDGTKSILFSTHLTEDLDQIGDYIAHMDNGTLTFSMDVEQLRERFVILEGTREELEQLPSSKIISLRHTPYGSSALAEYPEPDWMSRFSVRTPALSELMCRFQEGRKMK